MKAFRLIALLLLIVMAATPYCHATVINFTEVPFQPVDGLTVQGVTFGFEIDSVPSGDAHYASFGPVQTEHVTDPSVTALFFSALLLNFARRSLLRPRSIVSKRGFSEMRWNRLCVIATIAAQAEGIYDESSPEEGIVSYSSGCRLKNV